MNSDQLLIKSILTKSKEYGYDLYKMHGTNEFIIDSTCSYLTYRNSSGTGTVMLRDVIFDHNVAKALWPSKHLHIFLRVNESILENLSFTKEEIDGVYLKDWEYHLQQLAITENIIKYLKENI